MAARRFRGVLFLAYPQDHIPRHVHGFKGQAEVIVDLRSDGNVRLGASPGFDPAPDAMRSDVRAILTTAAEYFDELVAMWESMHE